MSSAYHPHKPKSKRKAGERIFAIAHSFVLGLLLATILMATTSCAQFYDAHTSASEGDAQGSQDSADISTPPDWVLFRTLQFGLDCSYDGYEHFFASFVASRVQEVPTAEAGIRSLESSAQSYGPWEASRNFEATDAPADGSISEWEENYYITHDWSSYGQQILAMQIGDTVCINGVSFRVEGVVDYPKNSFYGELRYLAGEDAIMLQTCVPGRDVNRHVWGRPQG